MDPGISDTRHIVKRVPRLEVDTDRLASEASRKVVSKKEGRWCGKDVPALPVPITWHKLIRYGQ